MRRGGSRAFLVALAIAGWSAAGWSAAGWGVAGWGGAARAAASERTAPHVASLSLTGVVDPFLASYVERGITHARQHHDAAVLLTIDTPGGLDSSMRKIVRAILASDVPVICYTAPSGARAASAGTFIMLACPINAMAPGTNIGAAHPVGVSGVIEQKKVTNDAAAFIRSLAERWHRDADWAERAVRDAVSASATDALRLHAVDAIADRPTSLLRAVGGCAGTVPGVEGPLGGPPTDAGPRTAGPTAPARLPRLCGAALTAFHRSITEGLFHSFADPNVAFLLVNLGFLALVVWVIHPGFHFALPLGIVLTVLGLLILETLPVRLAGLLLLLTAAVLFAVDVKAKAHGVLTAGGVAVFILGGLLLFAPAIPSARVSRPLLVGLGLAKGLFMFFVVRAVLSARTSTFSTGIGRVVGASGTTTTALDPTGTVRADGQLWSGASVAGPIPAGASVRVVGVEGLTLQVEPQPGPPQLVSETYEEGVPWPR